MAFIQINGINTNVVEMGRGKNAIVFIHGILVDNLSGLYFTLANALARSYRLLLYDLRGHGLTQRPKDGYDLDTLLDDLSGVINYGNPTTDSVYLLGHSYGGLIALAFAAQNRDRVSGLVLIDPPLPMGNWGEKISKIFHTEGDVRDRYIHEAYDSLHGTRLTRKRRRMEETFTSLLNCTNLTRDMKASRSLTEKEISSILCPALAIYGDHSEILSDAQILEQLVPHMETRLFPGCSHRVLFEATEEVRQTIQDWLIRQTAQDEGGTKRGTP